MRSKVQNNTGMYEVCLYIYGNIINYQEGMEYMDLLNTSSVQGALLSWILG